jgi:alkylated DNA repair dioxygenase AlkB
MAATPSWIHKADVSVARTGPEIPGLSVIKDFIDPDQEQELLERVNAGDWVEVVLHKSRTEPSRRVQHYGYEYKYLTRTVEPTEPLPDWAVEIASKIQTDATQLPGAFDQLIVNEYQPGQGITAHTDASCFGPCIVSLSLGSHCVMNFTNNNQPDVVVPVFLPARTLVVLTGDARTSWKHEIPCRKSDPHPKKSGSDLKRGTRVSLTFRTVE